MTNNDVENRVEAAFSRLAPDAFDAVLSDCGSRKGQVIMMTEKKRPNRWKRCAAGIAAAVLLMTGIFGVQNYRENYTVASRVSLDVNPSISITVNSRERVLGVVPLNDDAVRVIGDMDFSGSSLDVTVNALIGSMLRNGYLSEMANSILVSVDGKDSAKSAALQQKLTSELETMLRSDGFAGAVLSQTVASDPDLKALADRCGISEGKAQFICRLIEKDSRYTFGDLAQLSINELNLLTSSGAELESVQSVGSASDKRYVGATAAKKAALNHANVPESSISAYRCEFDWEDGMMVYEIEFSSGGLEYDYEINALTGAVVSFEFERDDGAAASAAASGAAQTAGNIGEAAAQDIALRHAGLKSGDITAYECALDREDGITVYAIEFKSGGFEYSYEINAATGAVIESDKDRDD